WDVKILATDIDTAILERGKKGDYDAHQWDKIPETCRGTLARLQANGTMSVSDDVKKLVCFKHLNLLEDWPMQGPFDAIFCRNVVIYFDKETQRHLFARMADLLKPQGWLYIGHSENLHYVSDRFTLLGSTIYRLNDHE
ncbi:MAG: chemotaxis protein CheR, partial [Alphaproteobacteria bacterium]|nr:chemotaxis protein CheR [Alphaproteobacteria bacterium]